MDKITTDYFALWKARRYRQDLRLHIGAGKPVNNFMVIRYPTDTFEHAIDQDPRHRINSERYNLIKIGNALNNGVETVFGNHLFDPAHRFIAYLTDRTRHLNKHR